MRREVGISIFAVLIVAAAILTVYYLNVGPTGFAVFQQDTQTAFNEGAYSGVLYDSNLSAIVLDSGANTTSGTYASKVLDAGSSATWNNLTGQWNGVTFEIRNCATANCSDANFIAVGDLNNLNLTGQYFQYKASFDSANDTLASVTVDYTVAQQPTPLSVSISQPAGEKSSLSAIPLTFTITGGTGTNPTCSYDINYAGGVLVSNTGINCASGSNTQTFDLSDKGGDNTVTLYVSDTSGNASASSGFSVSVSEEETTTGEETEEPVLEIPVETPSVTQISLGELSAQGMIQGDSRTLSLSVQNTGTVPVSSCILRGDDSGWVTIADGTKNLVAGESSAFAFSVNIPKETQAGVYTLGLSVTCAETSASKSLTVNVLQKKLDFNITDVQRTRQTRVSVDYTITELAGEDQDLEIYFSIKDASGLEVANAPQNRSINANATDDFRTNIAINESINGTMTLSAVFNSQIYSSSVLEPIDLSTVTGAAIFGGVGAGSLVILVVVVLILGAVFFVARRMRKSGRLFGGSSSNKED